MADTGVLNATSISQLDNTSGPAWTSPDNAIGDDGASATITMGSIFLISDWLIGNVTHGLGPGDIINGITVSVKRKYTPDNDGPCTGELQIVKDGSLVGDAKSISNWPETTTWSSDYGGASDLWGTTATGANSIGVAVSGHAADKYDVLEVFAFRVTIYYSTGDGISPTGTSGTRVVLFG